MSVGKNTNSTEAPRRWRELAWQAQHHPAFLGYLWRDLDEASIALTLGARRVTVWRLKLCLLPQGEADVRAVEAHFGLTAGRLGALLGEQGGSFHGPGVAPQAIMTIGGPS
ncbi:hypothetical protein E5F05_04340 (plasmid) [Deinococcus metallilatus]|uniref:Uncharacterized protein n=1 Tax=Deinococcus metallilatus TaxID=1211322 RepID=A0AAJ5F4V7_9DEIO|nr:hypothetical protein [Deinococcus metallilatus]MBB5293832.1 hypothetical protein [Deinococcus metallilatus]QBY07216.1 hypothetical protein E5F05_04340 [Deinococcus metallilatus]RXJ14688.1 hypothetical protein ERJ73_03070 [Deinococcus metallilatus]TLK30808.1 hypothetical protein FCS05_03385 [Deinococcus metallilatus]GMA17763.1 hypothetical protein GCM10025871_40940 [Deinococcus metallilatus]